MSIIQKNFKKGLFWSVFGRMSYLVIGFIINIIFARLLGPKEFGVIAIAFFFIAISQVLTESGLSGALVRKKNATEVDYSTIFFFNLLVSFLLYTLLFFLGSYIERFYDIHNLSLYLKVLGLILIIDAFRIIQKTKLIKQLDYKTITIIDLVSISLASGLAIILALKGFGIWALIATQVVNAFIIAVLYWIIKGGLKIYVFSKKSFKELFHYGLFTTLSVILDTVFDNIYQLILGKYFNLSQTGFYYQAKKITEVSVSIVKSTSGGIIFASLSHIQDNKDQFNKMFSNVVRIFTVIIGIICLCIYIYAREILYLIYGYKWISAAFYLKLLAVAYFFYMQELFNLNIFKVYNKTHKIFILEIIKKVLLSTSIIIGVLIKSIEVLMYGLVITYIINYFINYLISRTVYKSASNYIEMIFTLKTVAVSVLIGLVFEIVKKYADNFFLLEIYYFPIVMIIYILILSYWKVVHLRKDFGFLIKIGK